MLFEAGDDATSPGLDGGTKARCIVGAGGLNCLHRALTAGRLRRRIVSKAGNADEQEWEAARDAAKIHNDTLRIDGKTLTARTRR